jgi:HSP20 family protein
MVWLPISRFDPLFDPFRDLNRLQREINSLFSDRLGRGSEYPGINIWANDNEAVVTAEVPGVDPREIGVTVAGNALTVEGERKPEKLGKDDLYHRQERGFGRFVRTVKLPFEVESENIEARARHGLLMVKLPRKEATKPRKISIKAD